MSNENSILLQIWEGDYGIASVQPESLIILTYLKFTGLEAKIKYSNLPLGHRLPNLTTADTYLESYDNIFRMIFQMDHSIDRSLSILDMSTLRAYRTYYKSELSIIFYTTFWINDENYSQVTYMWYKHAMKFPFGYVFPYIFRRILLKEYSTIVDKIEVIVNASLRRGCDIIDDLAVLLGEKKYLYGETETSLDAVVFGYIAPLLKAPLKDKTIQNHLKSKENLVKWVNRITKKYYSTIPNDFKYVPNYDSKSPDDDASDGLLLSAGIIVGVVMVGFASVYGIINFGGRYGIKFGKK